MGKKNLEKEEVGSVEDVRRKEVVTVLVTVFLPLAPNSMVFGNGAKTLCLAVPGLWEVNTFCTAGMQPCKICLFLTTHTILARSHNL